MTEIPKWDLRHLKFAQHLAGWSKDPSTQVGAYICTQDRQPVSFGYNGLPKKVEDTQERYHDRELKYKMIVHAERNAIIFAKRDLTDCILYTYPFIPCTVCAGMVINAGIMKVVSFKFDSTRWGRDFDLT